MRDRLKDLAHGIQRNLLTYDPPCERTPSEITRHAYRVAREYQVPLSVILHDWYCGSCRKAPAVRHLVPLEMEDATTDIVSPLRVGPGANTAQRSNREHRVFVFLRECSKAIRAFIGGGNSRDRSDDACRGK